MLGIKSIGQRLTNWERGLRAHYNVVPIDADTERRARKYMRWFDHEILRHAWTNEFEIAPGVWRSNHPTPKRFQDLKARGITTVLTLRGSAQSAHHATEVKSCESNGLRLFSVALVARSAPPKDEILRLIDYFHTLDKPFLMHCKSGADRAGLASAIYLMVKAGKPVSEARKMLSFRFLHIRFSKTGVLDAFLDLYEQAEHAGIGFEEWVKSDYDQEMLQATHFQQ